MKPEFDVPARFRSGAGSSRNREFVDRREAIALFDRALAEAPPDEPRVLNYYGVGGIGKSRLQLELRDRTTSRPDSLSVRVDLQVPAMRRQDAVLAQLRRCLGTEHHIQLPLFDIAFSVYWQRTNPNVPMSGADLPLIFESEILADIVQAAGDAPVFGVVVNLVKGIDKLGRKAKRWQRVRNDGDLKDLDRLDAHELLDALTWFFAKDLLQVLHESKRHAVVFLDAHEALWEDVAARGGRGDRDAWIRDMVAQTPGVLWVLSSRDALRWKRVNASWCEPYLQCCAIGDLEPQDRLDFLLSCGVSGEVAQVIAAASEGVPFYLNVSVDHWESIMASRIPVTGDFLGTKEDLLSRFVGHIPVAEEEILKVLSIARSWDRELFEALIRHFNIAFPLSRWPDFCAYSFNRQTSRDRWLMHDLMRHELQRGLDIQLRREVHETIFGFERARADDAAIPIGDRAEALREALVHGIPAAALDPHWFMATVEFFMYRGRWQAIAPALEEMEASILAGQRADPALVVLRDFADAWILRQQGRLAEALTAFDHLDASAAAAWQTSIEFQRANALREAGRIIRAGRIYRDLWHSEPKPGQREIHLLAGIQLADFHYVQGRFRDASPILLQIAGRDKDENPREVAEALRILGHIERFNELPARGVDRYEDALALFAGCEDLFGQAIIQTNLAEAVWPIQPVEAVKLACRAIEMNEALGALLETGKAHTACAYGNLLLGQTPDALYQVEMAIEIQQRVGYRAGAAQAQLCRAFVRFASGNAVQAMEDIGAAVRTLEEIVAYPTLRLAAAHGARLMGDVTSRPREIRRTALTGLQWIGPAAASEHRLELLVERLAGAGR